MWFSPVDAVIGVVVWAQQEQPVIGHHDSAASSHADEEHVTGDADFSANFVFFTSDRSGSFSGHRAAGHGGGKLTLLFLPGGGKFCSLRRKEVESSAVKSVRCAVAITFRCRSLIPASDRLGIGGGSLSYGLLERTERIKVISWVQITVHVMASNE